MSSLVVLMNLVVCCRSSLNPRAFLQALVLGAGTVSVFYCVGGRTAEHALGFVYLSPILK